jgi:hypothetical protein
MNRGPKQTFGKQVIKAAGYSALGAAALTADVGNPLVNAAVGLGVGAVGGAVHHIVKSVQAANDDVRYQERVDAVKEKQQNRNLGRQFK